MKKNIVVAVVALLGFSAFARGPVVEMRPGKTGRTEVVPKSQAPTAGLTALSVIGVQLNCH